MKRTIPAVMFAIAAIGAAGAHAADVGVSVSIGQPGFYGRIDIGGYPPPPVVYPRPVIIQPVPVGVVAQPVYLRVPPGHQRNWGKHCAKYGACGQPVYFVQDQWYTDVYAPRYRERDDDDHGRGHGNGHGKGRGHGKG